MKIKLKKQTDFELLFTTEKIPNLQVGKWYEIKPYKKNRSLEQNKAIWHLIELLAIETGEDKWNVYISCLLDCKILCEYVQAPVFAEETLKRTFRIVDKKGEFTNEKGNKIGTYLVFVGSSNFNTNECKMFVDYLVAKCNEYGINIDYFD